MKRQDMQPRCANCQIIITWLPTIVDGQVYCCPGCAEGGGRVIAITVTYPKPRKVVPLSCIDREIQAQRYYLLANWED